MELICSPDLSGENVYTVCLVSGEKVHLVRMSLSGLSCVSGENITPVCVSGECNHLVCLEYLFTWSVW